MILNQAAPIASEVFSLAIPANACAIIAAPIPRQTAPRQAQLTSMSPVDAIGSLAGRYSTML